MMEAEWYGRAAFAEFAEAIGIDTDSIIAVEVRTSNSGHVMWSEDSDIIAASFDRDADGLIVIGPAAKIATLDDLAEAIERTMRLKESGNGN